MNGASAAGGATSHPVPARAPRELVALVAVLAGSAAVVGSGFLTWLDVVGDTRSGFGLAELLTDLRARLPEAPPAWTGAVWYLVPAIGALGWVVAFHRHPVAVRPRLHLALGALSVLAAAGYLAVSVGTVPTPGPLVSGLGGFATMAGAGLQARHERIDPDRRVRP